MRNGYFWIFLDILGYFWIFLDIFGYSWIFLDILGYFVCARDFVRAILCARDFVRARPWESGRPKTRKSPKNISTGTRLNFFFTKSCALMPAKECAQF